MPIKLISDIKYARSSIKVHRVKGKKWKYQDFNLNFHQITDYLHQKSYLLTSLTNFSLQFSILPIALHSLSELWMALHFRGSDPFSNAQQNMNPSTILRNKYNDHAFNLFFYTCTSTLIKGSSISVSERECVRG